MTIILVKILKRKNVFRDCYIVIKDISIDSINFNNNEVMDCKYVSAGEFKEIIKKVKVHLQIFRKQFLAILI